MNFDIRCIESKEKGLIKRIGEILVFLKKDYPFFYNWYNDKIVNGADRKVYIATPRDNNDVIMGILILKDAEEEKKICTLCVMEAYRGNGIGTAFIELAINSLKTNRPMITVSESNKDMFDPILSKYEFEEVGEYFDYYKKGVVEFSYNGYLPEYKEVVQAI